MTINPNILILWCDQMQYARQGRIDEASHTPNLDKLWDEGVPFTHAYTVHAQCVPSRAALMTGQSPHECGVMVNYGFYDHQNRLTKKHTTLAHVLRDAGYKTAYYGKSHLGSPLEDLGFDHGRNYDTVRIEDDEAEQLGIGHVPLMLRRDYKAAWDAVDFLKTYQPGEQPLFFVFSTNLPHPPFFSEHKYAHLFPPDQMKLSTSFYEETFEGKPSFQKTHALDGSHGASDEAGAKKELADYYTMIAMTDEHIGAVTEEYKRLGIWDDTLVLFLSDHGDMMGAHRMRLKGTLPYEELYHVPCIFKLPVGISSARTVIDDLVSSQAFAGTLLKLANIGVPSEFTGGHFTEAFTRIHHPDDECMFFEHYAAYWGLHPFYGVRTRSMKYVRYYGDDDTEELYDLEKDPDELRNLAGEVHYVDIQRVLANRADAWWQSTDGRDVNYYESDFFRQNLHNKVD